MKPITVNEKHKTRILRPYETTDLINAIPRRRHETQFKALLLSGMRYIETQRFFEHPEWFDGNFIHLPSLAVKKAKRKQKERWVRLNPLGKEVVKNFLEQDANLPAWTTWSENLKRWAEKAGLEPIGLSPKATRKTWESWLVYYYPDKLTNIVLSQGHTVLTAIQHYINMPFTEDDKKGMREFVEGWI